MHDEALVVLPALLETLGLEQPLLIGHSDGASIAIIHAGAGYPVAGLVLIAPHVFVEVRTLDGIRAARRSYEAGPLRARLARYHADVDATFDGWSGAWLDPAFADWNIEEFLPNVTAPALIIQGREDEYATMAQVDTIARSLRGPVSSVVLEGVGHAPHLEAPNATLGYVAAFLPEIMRRRAVGDPPRDEPPPAATRRG
jgi:pimeloyl-ACP methyl ester carboxylesterase